MKAADTFERVQAYIRKGIDEDARVVCGGPGRPPGIERGYFVQPTSSRFLFRAAEERFANAAVYLVGRSPVDHRRHPTWDADARRTSMVLLKPSRSSRTGSAEQTATSSEIQLDCTVDFRAPPAANRPGCT